MGFNRIEEKIIRILFNYKAPLTIYEIAKESGISYPSAKKYTEILTKRGIIVLYPTPTKGIKEYYFKPELLKRLEKDEK